jgi:hypothetical protein
LTGIVKDLVEHDIRMLYEWKDVMSLWKQKVGEKLFRLSPTLITIGGWFVLIDPITYL